MPVYKDEKRNTWFVKFRYRDWQGKIKWVTKRGFETKREAKVWENDFKIRKSDDIDLTFGEFVERYRENLYPRIKHSTAITKDNIIDKRLLPYFGDRKITEITTNDVVRWQNEMIRYRVEKTGKKFTKSYLKTLHNQLSAILNHGVKFYGMKENVASKVGNMGSENDIRINFWTLDEYQRFAEEMKEDAIAYYCFEVLYWTGMRRGELLALTLSDIDFDNMKISISKTYFRNKGVGYTTSPKTRKSNRIISIPEFLRDELREYCDMTYAISPKSQLFPVGSGYLRNELIKGANKAGLKQIRIHDLRHSHASLLINMGYSAVAVANRLGHESIDITFRYAHLFPSVQNEISSKLNDMKEEFS